MKSHVVDLWKHYAGLSPEEAAEYFKPGPLRMRPVAFISMVTFWAMLLDVLQLFIPKLRLR